MINAYQELIGYNGDDFEEFCRRICLIEIFKDLIEKYQDPEKVKTIVKYIVWAYSRQSDKVIEGRSWKVNKQEIFKAAGVPEELADEVMDFDGDDVIRDTINKWLDFQDDEALTELYMLKDLRREMQKSANSIIRKSSGEVDYDQKMKNAEYSKTLRGMITAVQAELIQNDTKLKEAARETKTSRQRRNTIGLENFAS